MEVVVTGIGLLTSLGFRAKSWQRLLKGERGIALHQPFPELPQRPLGLIEQQLSQRNFSLPNPGISRLSHLTKLIVAEALIDAQLTAPLPDCGVVVGSSRCCQGDWEKLARNQHGHFNPSSWLNTLPNQAAVVAAQQIGALGIVLAPMAACATGIWTIAQGFELIRTGQCNLVIAGAVEAPITPLTLAGFARMGALAKTGCYPFDKHREGLVLGEGGAILLLESAESAQSRGVMPYGQIQGFACTSDAYHVSAPDPQHHGAITAVKKCLQQAHLSPTEIDYIHAHGTSTVLNDDHEAQLIEYLFPQGVAVSSTKGATGHTLGASGAIGAAFCLLVLQQQQLPPCVGLKEPEFALDLVTKARQTSIRQALCFSFGFGGQNAVLAMQKLDDTSYHSLTRDLVHRQKSLLNFLPP